MGSTTRTVGLPRAATAVKLTNMGQLRWLPDQAKPPDGLVSA